MSKSGTLLKSFYRAEPQSRQRLAAQSRFRHRHCRPPGLLHMLHPSVRHYAANRVGGSTGSGAERELKSKGLDNLHYSREDSRGVRASNQPVSSAGRIGSNRDRRPQVCIEEGGRELQAECRRKAKAVQDEGIPPQEFKLGHHHPFSISMQSGGEQLSEAPDVICDSGFHERRNPDRGMDPAEIVVRVPEREGSVMHRPFFREGVAQTRVSSRRHSSRKVVAFHVRGTNPFHIRLAVDRNFLCARTFGWRVPCFGLGIVLVQLHELREVNTLRSETQNDGMLIRLEPICGHLETALSCVCQFIGEDDRIGFRSLSKMPCEHHLAIALDCREHPAITNGVAFYTLAGFGALLHSDILPLLVTLNFRDAKTLDASIHEALAPLTGQRQKIKNGSNVNAGDSGRAADRAAFDQMLNHRERFVFCQDHIAEQSFMRLEKSFLAGQAAIALQPVSILTEFLRWAVTALAVHFVHHFLATRVYTHA